MTPVRLLVAATFENVKRWHKELVDNAADKAVILLVGNKSDLQSTRTVSREDATVSINCFGSDIASNNAYLLY